MTIDDRFPLGEPTKPTPDAIERMRRDSDRRLREEAERVADDKDQRFLGEER